ncbi:uncharacterized protein LOC134275708 [Saccostrea cucullata]|uniref:uncharacterized protein LOC134275708 n=1 Tax=Saccostrea cuccullata TaxID=36930 RepID=UPI002ED52900
MPKRKSNEEWGDSDRPRKRLSKGTTVEDALINIEEQVKVVRQEIQNQESIQGLHETIDQLQKKLEAERSAKSEALKAKEEALNRLSSVAANRLRDNNPGITDLSDPNRPIKLGEKASEIYDNEWTNALENLEELRKANETAYDEEKEEKDVVLLLSILTDIFQMCKADALEHIENISRVLLTPSFVKIKHKPKVPLAFLKEIKDFRKQHCTESILQSLTEHYMEKLPEQSPDQLTPEVIKACQEYIHKCVELSWLMSIQDPPMCLEWQFKGGDFRSDTMRSFTKSGDKVQFVVWPAMYLHDGGPLVTKAIVQGMKTGKKKRQKN